MKVNRIIVVLFLSLISRTAATQDFGLSFSYFLPKNGDFSTPISPFSIRGLGFDLNRFVAVQAGASLYRMSGLNLKDLPFESSDALIGPNFTILVPAELVLQLKGSRVQFDIKGGGFFFHGFGNKINYGNFDKAMIAHYNWQLADGDLSFKAKPGFGYHAGAELTFPVTNQVSLSLEGNYLIGESKFPLTGSYQGYDGSNTIEENVNFSEAKIDFTGLEISVGLIFSANAGPKAPKRRRR